MLTVYTTAKYGEQSELGILVLEINNLFRKNTSIKDAMCVTLYVKNDYNSIEIGSWKCENLVKHI